MRKTKTKNKQQMKKIEFIEKHILTVLCNGDAKQYEFVTNWIYSVLCGKKNTTALVIYGTTGLGKSKIIDMLKKIIGAKASITVSDLKSVEGFNGWMAGKLLINFDDPINSTQSTHDALKPHITEPQLGYRYLYKDTTTLTNIANIVVTAEKSAFAIKDEIRRLCYLDTNPSLQSEEYYNRLDEYVNDKDVCEAYYFYAKKNFSEEWFKNQQTIIKSLSSTTKEKELSENIPMHYQFLIANVLKDDEDIFSENIKPSIFYEIYSGWYISKAKSMNYRNQTPMSKNKFINEMLNVDGITQVKISTMFIKFNKQKILTYLKKKRYLTEFDEIDSCNENMTSVNKEIEMMENQLLELKKKRLSMMDATFKKTIKTQEKVSRIVPNKTKVTIDDMDDIFTM